MPPAYDSEELLRPSLEGYAAPTVRPWRTGSIFYVAFFGGIVPAVVLAWINAGRLQVSEARRFAVGVVGLVGLFATMAVPLALDMSAADNFQLTSRILGVAGFGVVYSLLRPAERVYGTFGRQGDGRYASLWGPGLLALFVLGTLQNVVVYVVLSQ
jgi:hypothetical protein